MPQDFHEWMKAKTRRVVGYAGLLAVLKVTIDYVFPLWQSFLAHVPKHLQPIMSEVINIVLLLIIGGLFVWRRPQVDSRFRKATTAVTHFHVAWRWFWLLFLLMYLNGTYLDYYFHSSPEDALKSIPAWLWRRFIDNTLSNLTLLALFVSYVVLAGYKVRNYLLTGICACIALAMLEIALIVGSSSLGNDQSLFASLIWQMLLGGIAGTVLALFVGRLENRVINPPLWLIFALYFYASLQPIYAAIQATSPILEFNHYKQFKAILDTAAAAISVVAAILKIALFALIYWLLDTGVMLFYCNWLHEPGRARGEIHAQRDEFLANLHRPAS